MGGGVGGGSGGSASGDSRGGDVNGRDMVMLTRVVIVLMVGVVVRWLVACTSSISLLRSHFYDLTFSFFFFLSSTLPTIAKVSTALIPSISFYERVYSWSNAPRVMLLRLFSRISILSRSTLGVTLQE